YTRCCVSRGHRPHKLWTSLGGQNHPQLSPESRCRLSTPETGHKSDTNQWLESLLPTVHRTQLHQVFRFTYLVKSLARGTKRMRFSLQREALLKPLAQVVNVVERRQTLPVLANLLTQVSGGQLSLTGTDLEVEMISRVTVDDAQDGETTIPARKLFDIVRALPDGSKVTVSQNGDKITVQAGRSRFTLSTLPANDFPSVDEVEATERVSVPEAALKELIERTAFAMAQQDVRYYLNGLLFDLADTRLRCVA